VSTAVAPESGLQPTAAVRERRTEPAEATTAADAAAFVAAASRNSLLKLDLNWAFGGKQQRGWYIYEPLISRLIGSEKDSAAADPSLNLKHTAGGELAPEEKFLKIVSAFRPREYQEQLRRQSPNSGRAGLAVNSPHFTGRALDLYVGGEPVETKDANRAVQVQTNVYRWLVRNADKFGFRPYYYEPWHWEYVGTSAT